MKGCQAKPSSQWDNLEWLAAYNRRVERLKHLATLGAPYNVMASEAIMVLHAITHLQGPVGAHSEVGSVRCVIRSLEQALMTRETEKLPAPVRVCPNALLPDGPVCPRCKGKRAPSGVDGGSWVHVKEK